MPKEKTNRAVTVARMSGGPGQDRELSHGGQDSVMFPYCEKKGLVVIKSFYEVASGLEASKRPVFLDVMDHVLEPENRISHVVFHDLSRFSRSKSDPQTFMKLLDENDVIIHSASDETNSDDDNELLWDVNFIFNNKFSKTISQLTIRGQSESVRMGNDISPVVTYGYEKYYVEEGGRRRPRWKPYPEHAEIVLLIFVMRAKNIKPMDICNHLNGQGIPAPRGGLWTTGTIRRMLRDLTYLGYSQVGKTSTSAFPRHRRSRELVQNPKAHPSIVSEDLFNKVQELMPKKPREEREPPRSNDSPNPISNRAKCGNRKHKLANMIIANSKGGGKKLTCSVRKNSGVDYCDNPEVELEDFLKTLGTALKERLSAPSIIQEQLKTLTTTAGEYIVQEKSRQEAITKRLKEIEREKTNLMAALKNASERFPENVSDFNSALSALNKEKEQLTQEQKELVEETQDLIAFLTDPEGVRETIQELGEQIDPDDLKVTSNFLKTFINRVDVYGEEATMYYSVPLSNTTETQTGYKASETIRRSGAEFLLEHCAPAGAGIDRSAPKPCQGFLGFPRRRGDRPRPRVGDNRRDRVPPQARG